MLELGLKYQKLSRNWIDENCRKLLTLQTVPQVQIKVIHLNNAGAGSEITKTFMKLKWSKLSKVTYLAIMIQWVMITIVQLRKGMWVQTNLGGQVALSDSNFVPCPRNLPTRTEEDVQASPSYPHTLSSNCCSSPDKGRWSTWTMLELGLKNNSVQLVELVELNTTDENRVELTNTKKDGYQN